MSKVTGINLGIGKTYDLKSLFDRLNKLYFDDRLQLTIRWAQRTPSKARRKILLGCFRGESKTIVMSRRLDRPEVPLYFVEHVLFHEMLHAVFPSKRYSMHSEQFRRYEKLHPDFEQARRWEKENISILFGRTQSVLPFLSKLFGQI
jgi:hypothetical protein